MMMKSSAKMFSKLWLKIKFELEIGNLMSGSTASLKVRRFVL